MSRMQKTSGNDMPKPFILPRRAPIWPAYAALTVAAATLVTLGFVILA